MLDLRGRVDGLSADVVAVGDVDVYRRRAPDRWSSGWTGRAVASAFGRIGAMPSHRRATRSPRAWIAASIVAVVAVCAASVAIAALSAQPKTSTQAILDYTPEPVPTPSPTPLKTMAVFIGDSFVSGSDMGGNGPKNWTELASRELNWYPCSFGIGGSGWTRGINDWSYGARVDWALSLNPSLIVFVNGINDLRSADEIESRADSSLAQLRDKAPDMPVLIVGQIRVRDEQSPFVENANERLSAVAEKYGALFISPTTAGWFDGPDRSNLGSDAFHPTDEGSIYLANKFIAAIGQLPLEPRVRLSDALRTCSTPDWRTTHPDGTQAIPTSSPTPSAHGGN